jgi:hypothetical protein
MNSADITAAKMPSDAVAGSGEKSDQQLRGILENLERASLRGDPVEQVKRRASRRLTRYLVAICIGVAGTLAWQSYGDAIKQLIAARAPELGWSPQAKQMIASWAVGWTKPPAGPEKIAPDTAAPKAPPAPSIDPAQVQQITQSLAGLHETVEQIAASENQTSREIARLESAVAELILKFPEPSAQPPERKPVPVPPSSRAPTAPQSSRTLTPRH